MMFNGTLRCLTHLMTVLVFLRVVCGLPADEVVRNETVKDMRKYMNESVEPCDNFYEFSCGNWPKYHPLAKENINTNLFNILSDDFDQKVKKLMKIDDSNDSELEQKVKSFYQSCLNLPNKWDDYIENLKKLADDFGKMPAIAGDTWQEADFDWLETVAAIQAKYGIGTIVNSLRLNDLHDTMASAVYIDHGSNTFDAKSIYFDDEYETTRVKHKVEMATVMTDYLAIPKDVANQTAEDIFAFAVSLAHGDPDENVGLQIEEIYFPITLEKLQNTYSPVLNMTQLISTAFGSIPPYNYYENRIFLENLVKVMPKTPKKTVANFIYYTLIEEFVFKKSEDTTDHEDNCISTVRKYFWSVFENIVYHHYALNRAHSDLEVMWNDIKLAFEDILKSPKLNWIHSDARKSAVEKLNAVKFKVPAAEVNKDVARVLKQITIDKDDFLLNMKTLRSAAASDESDKLYEPSTNPLETSSDLAFTPTYLVQLNKITVPVAVLQPHFMFSPSLPRAFNFGRLGTLIGHEVVHGFDDMGRKYDKSGNVNDWWDTNSTDAFNDRVKCFIDQYEQYEFGGQKLPRRIDQGENIADNGGLHVAYQAYLKWYEDSARTGQEQQLETFPGFLYNNRQLFFISFAQQWCGDTSPEYKREIVATDSHTPVELRAMAAVSNMNEFSQVFNCPLGSPMNPVGKCEIY